MKNFLLMLLLALGLAPSGWTTEITTIIDTTVFNKANAPPWTDPEEDYVSHTFGVATFLSAESSYPEALPDGIRWVHHFTPPPSGSITAARLLITFDDDDETDDTPFGPGDAENGILSIEGEWTRPDDVTLMNSLGKFEVDDGTVAFTLSTTKISWLYDGVLDSVFRSTAGDFYIVRSDLEVTIASDGDATGYTPQNGTWAIDEEVNGKPGRGFQIDVQNDVLVLYFYGYEQTGESTYWLAAGKLNPGSDEITADLGAYAGGMAFGDPMKNATYLGPVGTVTMRFSSPDRGEICLPNESCKSISAFNFGYEASAQSLLGTWLVSLTKAGSHGMSGSEGVTFIFDQLIDENVPGVEDVAKGAAYFIETGSSGIDQTIRADVECSRIVVPSPPFFDCNVKAPGVDAIPFKIDVARNALTGVMQDPGGELDIAGFRVRSATEREVLPN